MYPVIFFKKNFALINIFIQIIAKKCYFVSKIVLVMEKNFWNSKLKAQNLQIFWDQ